MGRSTAAMFLAGCISLHVWGQKPPDKAPVAEQQSGNQSQVQPTPDNHPAAAVSSAKPATAAPSGPSGFPMDRFQEFSAIMRGGNTPGFDWDGHIYRSHNLMRMQGNFAKPNYFISDLEKQTTHGLAASGCMKMGNLYVRSFPFFLSGPEYKYERVPAGKETVDGHVCRVEDITITPPKRPPGKIRIWEAEDLQGFPIKIENRRENGRHWIIRYENVALGPQDPTLFIVPDKCQSGIPEDPNEEEDQTPTPKKTPGGKSQ